MTKIQRRRRSARVRPRRFARLCVEQLEGRDLPSGTPGLTADASLYLGDLATQGILNLNGAISKASPADVEWYSFTLSSAVTLNLSTLDRQIQSPFVSVISLYATDGNDPNQMRLLLQDDGASNGGDASLERSLAPLGPNTYYYVAVSGSGDNYFFPYLADSGYAGSTGAYNLHIRATPLNPNASGLPSVLAVDASPQLVRVDLSANPDLDVINNTLQISGGSLASPYTASLMSYVTLDPVLPELQIQPPQPLASGTYTLSFDLANPGGTTTQSYSTTFVINNNDNGDDTPATAHSLGDITSAGLVQVAGAIGDDPYYSFTSFAPGTYPGNDVNMYHFQISGPGLHAFAAEVFAGRINSTLDPGITLYELVGATLQQAEQGDITDSNLQVMAVNDNSGNTTPPTNGGPPPLYTDPVVYAALLAGDYFLAVSSTGNVPDPFGPTPPSTTTGLFDPITSHSGQNGFPTGNYVLNMLVQPDQGVPHVTATTPAGGAVLDAPPTQLTIQFSQAVNLQQLAYEGLLNPANNQPAPIYVQSLDTGAYYYTELQSYDTASNQATLLMLDGLPNGRYALHLSGAQGLTSLSGEPLAGNDPSGDYIVDFTVQGPARGVNGDGLHWSDQGNNNSPDAAQVLGALFPNELAKQGPPAGVTLTCASNTDTDNSPDYYQIQLLQTGQYFIGLSDAAPGSQLSVYDVDNQISLGTFTRPFIGQLTAGTYIIEVIGSGEAGYGVNFALLGANENVPLTSGPAPALRIILAEATPPATPGAPPQVSLPALPNTGFESVSATQMTHLVSLASGTLPGAAGPLGGVAAPGGPDAAFAFDGALAQGPYLSLVEDLLQLTILTQGAGADSGPNAAWTPPAEPGVAPPSGASITIGDYLRGLERSWNQALDAYFSKWNGVPAMPALDPGSVPGNGVSTENPERSSADQESLFEDLEESSGETAFLSDDQAVPDEAFAGALAGAALFAGVGAEGSKRRS